MLENKPTTIPRNETCRRNLMVISVDSDPRRGIRPGPTNLCVLMSQLAAAAAPRGIKDKVKFYASKELAISRIIEYLSTKGLP